MSDQVERTTRDVTVRIERDACAAFEHCVEEAPEAFQLGDDGIASFSTPENVTKEQLIRACLACPVEALHAIDDNGQEITTEEDTASTTKELAASVTRGPDGYDVLGPRPDGTSQTPRSFIAPLSRARGDQSSTSITAEQRQA